VSGDQQAIGGEIETPIPLVIGGVPKKDTASRAGRKLVRSCGGEVRVAGAPEDTQVLVGGSGAEQGKVRSGGTERLGGKAVQQVGGGVEALSPVTGREGGLEQQGAHDVVGGANHALGLAVLRRSVGAGHPQLHTEGQEEGTGRRVVKLSPVVALNTLDGATELRGHPSEEARERGKRVRLQAQRKSPRVMSAIIKNHQVIFIARDAQDRRGPQITVNKIKSLHSLRGGARKG